jgi:hypothetical protein
MTPQAKITQTSITVRGKRYARHVVTWYDEQKKRQRKTFASSAEADEEAKRVNKLLKSATERETIIRRRIGEDGTKLSSAVLRDAVDALAILKGMGSLVDAAGYFVKHARPDAGEKTIAECCDLFLKRCESEGLRPATLRSYRQQIERMARELGGSTKMNEITIHVFEPWLNKAAKSQGSRKSYLRHLGAFFNYAIARGFMVTNPTANLGSKGDKNIVRYLTPAEADLLLTTAANSAPELVPYIAIGLFAGLRPSEMHGENTEHPPLDWRHIYLAGDKPHIDIKPEQDKNRRGRRVDISKNLLLWLAPHVRDAGPVEYSRSRFQTLLKAARVAYSKDVMRHTFGTWHHAMHRHKGETAVQLGDTIETVTKHYVNDYVHQEDAAAFWAIVPKGDKAVIRFREQKAS